MLENNQAVKFIQIHSPRRWMILASKEWHIIKSWKDMVTATHVQTPIMHTCMILHGAKSLQWQVSRNASPCYLSPATGWGSACKSPAELKHQCWNAWICWGSYEIRPFTETLMIASTKLVHIYKMLLEWISSGNQHASKSFYPFAVTKNMDAYRCWRSKVSVMNNLG